MDETVETKRVIRKFARSTPTLRIRTEVEKFLPFPRVRVRSEENFRKLVIL